MTTSKGMERRYPPHNVTAFNGPISVPVPETPKVKLTSWWADAKTREEFDEKQGEAQKRMQASSDTVKVPIHKEELT